MASITSKAAPLPKLRVTCFSCKTALPQWAQWRSTEVDSNDDELARETDFDDGFGTGPFERDAIDDTLDFTGLSVALTLTDLPREDDVFEIEDGKVVIVQFLCRVG